MMFTANDLILHLKAKTIVDIAVNNLYPNIMENIKWISMGDSLNGNSLDILYNVQHDEQKGYPDFAKKVNLFVSSMNLLEEIFPLVYLNDFSKYSYSGTKNEIVTEESRTFHIFAKNYHLNNITEAKQFIQEWIKKSQLLEKE